MRIIHWTAAILWQAEWVFDFCRPVIDILGTVWGLDLKFRLVILGILNKKKWSWWSALKEYFQRSVIGRPSHQPNFTAYLPPEGIKQSLIAPLNLDSVENRGDWSKFSSLSCASVQIVNRFGDNNDNKKDFRLLFVLFVVARDCADSSIAPPTTNDSFCCCVLMTQFLAFWEQSTGFLSEESSKKAMLSPETWFHYWMAELIRN